MLSAWPGYKLAFLSVAPSVLKIIPQVNDRGTIDPALGSAAVITAVVVIAVVVIAVVVIAVVVIAVAAIAVAAYRVENPL
jgi:hypothetical protein